MLSNVFPSLAGLFTHLWWVIPLAIFINVLRSNWFKGKLGEWFVNIFVLDRLEEDKGGVVKDVILPTIEGTTQLDHILLSKHGIFVIETKNMTGWIFGSGENAYWTQVIYRNKTRFQNPLRQNYKHVKTIKRQLGIREEYIHSVVVFVGGAKFKTPVPENVLYASELRGYVKSFNQVVFTEQELSHYRQKLSDVKLDNTRENRRLHTAHVKSLLSPTNTKMSVEKNETCPRCGAALRKRVAKRGAQAGRSFYGCSQFPKCRFTRNC